MKRDSVSVYVHMRYDIPSPLPPPPYAVVRILDDPPILTQAAYGLECNFYVENLKIALFCNTLIYKLQVFCSLKLKLYYWDFTMCGTCSRKKRTNLFKRQTIQRLTKFLIITFFMHFFKTKFRTWFPWQNPPIYWEPRFPTQHLHYDSFI